MNRKNSKTIVLVPLILLLTIVPLIVHIYESSVNMSQFDWYPVNDKVVDFFLYYKAVAITIVAVIMCCVLAYRYKLQQKEFKLCYEFIPVGVYAVLSLISSLFSQYRYFSFHGSTEMYESVWVVLGYCMIAFYAYQMINTIEDADCIMKWLTIGLAAMLVLGISQAVGHDLLMTRVGKILITNPDRWDKPDSISLVFEKGRVFLAAYNPNFVASYFSLMIPMEVALLIKNKKWTYRVAYIVMLIASVVCLLASGNRSGIVAFAVTSVLTIVLLHRQILRAWKFVVPAIAVVGIICAAYISKNDLIVEKFVRLFSASEAADDAISEIVTGDEDVAITYLGEELHVSYQIDEAGNVTVAMTDGEGQTVSNALDESGSTFVLDDERFPGFYVQVVQMQDESIGINVFADNRNWYFQKGEDGTYYYYNVFGKLDKINNAPRVAVKFLEKKFEERGTIWSKTIPLLKDCILFGSGVGTFVVTYPQDDYVDKVYDNSTTSFDVKPHCFYLQVAVESGIPALIAVVVFYAWYFISGFKLYMKCTYQKPLEIFGVGLLLATFTYMVISFLNDSTVTVAPIYWLMMGMGVAINQILQRENKLQEERAAAELLEKAEQNTAAMSKDQPSDERLSKQQLPKSDEQSSNEQTLKPQERSSNGQPQKNQPQAKKGGKASGKGGGSSQNKKKSKKKKAKR